MRYPPAFLLLTLILLTLPSHLHGADAGLVPDAFNAADARRPRPGEWLEYRLAFPVDPLENSLSATPVPPTPDLDSPPPVLSGNPPPFQPSFDAPTAWRVLPLRLEILEVGDNDCKALMSFAGERNTVSIPLQRQSDPRAFHYEAPQPPDQRLRLRIGTEDYEVDRAQRHGRGYGFARLANPGLPFGLARFATENIDLILVGMGSGVPPDFPLADAPPASPPPGLFYREDR